MYTITCYVCCAESKVVTERDINRYVTTQHTVDWEDIGIELNLQSSVLNNIEKDHPQQNKKCFLAMIEKWKDLTHDKATWKALEFALTNVNRQKLGLNPIDDDV